MVTALIPQMHLLCNVHGQKHWVNLFSSFYVVKFNWHVGWNTLCEHFYGHVYLVFFFIIYFYFIILATLEWCVSPLEVEIKLCGITSEQDLEKQKDESVCILTKVSNAALSILFNQYIFALEVSVGDGRFALCAEDLNVEVHQAACNGQRHAETAGRIEGAELKVVVQGAHLVEVSDQPQLSAGIPWGHVWSYEAYIERRTSINDRF